MQTLLSSSLVNEMLGTTASRAKGLIGRGVDPQLAAVLVGDNPESVRYVAMKAKRAKEAGIILSTYHLEGETSYEHVAEVLAFLAKDADMHGIILQLPLPDRFSSEQTDALLALIPASKDVDGLRGDWQTQEYAAPTREDLLVPRHYAIPPMVGAVVSLLDRYKVPLLEQRIVLVGEGRLVGGPLLSYFRLLGLDVQPVDEETEGILAIASEADVLIAGTGQKDLVTYQWVKEGATVVDCAADVHYDSVSQVAGALAPSIGGVGPLTMAWLLENTVQAALNQYPEDSNA
jgi:methylenetetrahydrofolate dehydrogenase (NADP+)/methenyltetrahydrofolate cyclohydrolase